MFTLFVENEEHGCFEANQEGLDAFREFAQKYCAWNGFYYLRPDTDKAEKFLSEHGEI